MEGYEDIDRLTQKQEQMLDNSLQKQQDIVNQQTDMNVAEIERNKQKLDEDVNKTNRALYTEYKKASNPYGANAERLASQGLLNSGYAETTQTNLYNTYQKNVTDTLNNARNLKADFDNEITKARQTGNLTLAQNALDLYKQKMQLLTQEYELRNNREQFLYQKSQNALAQSNWEKEWARQKERDAIADSQYREQFDYQKSRDAIADEQWREQFEESKKASARASSGRSGGSSGSSYAVSLDDLDESGENAVALQDSTNGNENTGNWFHNAVQTVKNSIPTAVGNILQSTEPNSQARKNALFQLVTSKILNQDEAIKLISAK